MSQSSRDGNYFHLCSLLDDNRFDGDDLLDYSKNQYCRKKVPVMSHRSDPKIVIKDGKTIVLVVHIIIIFSKRTVHVGELKLS